MATPQQMLATLLNAPTPDQMRQQLIQILQGFTLPTSDWTSTGWERGMVEADSQALWTFIANLIPQVTAGGFVDLANAQWLPLLALELYNLTQNGASYTQGNEVLTCNAASGPYTITPGQLYFTGAGGNVYNNLTGGVLGTGGQLAILLQALNPGSSYNDGANTITQLSTPLSGVTCNNPAPTYSTPVRTGTGGGTGTITASGVPSGSHSVSVRIDGGGQSGVATWSYSLDGGAYVSAGAVASAVVGSGITVTLVNGSINPSFVVGDYYSFNTPGSWITQAGVDVESVQALAGRCKNRWPSLATLAAIPGSPTLGFYDLLVRQASSQITRTLSITDGTVNNKINLYIAGPAGAVPASIVSLAQAYLNVRNMLTDLPVVATPANRVVNFGGATIKVVAAFLASAQAALQGYLQNYMNGNTQTFALPNGAVITIPGVGINGLVELWNVEQLAGFVPGITNFSGLTIGHDGGSYAASDFQLPFAAGSVEVATWGEQVASIFAWLGI